MRRRAGQLLVAACLLGAALANGIPAAAALRGEQLLVVLSGSMVPLFHAGDAVVVTHPHEDELARGMVVSFHAPGSPDRLTTHRIHALVRRPEGLFLQTKGDANPAPDPDFTPAGSVTGVMGAAVPHLGYALSFGQSPAGKLLLLGVPLLALLLAQVGTLRRLRAHGPPGDPASRTHVAAVAFLVVLAGSGGVLAAKVTSSLLTDVEPASANTFSTATFCASATTYRARVLQDAPSLYLRLGEASGTAAADSSTLARNGTYQGSPALGAEGAIKCDTSTAVDFDGTNDWISTAARISALTTFSEEAWFRTTTGGGELVGFGTGTTGASTTSDRQLYMTTSGQLAFSVDPALAAAKAITSPATYLDGRWHHVVATYAATNGVQRLYVDGAQVATATGATGLSTYTGAWRAGYDQLSAAGGTPPSRLFFAGRLDEVAVYPTALSATTVSAHYAANGA